MASVSGDFKDIDSWLPKSDLLVTYVAGPFPDDRQVQRVAEWLDGGGRWLALHGTSGGRAVPMPDGSPGRMMSRAPHHEVLGAFFLNHPPIRKFRVDVCDRDHPLARGLPDGGRLVCCDISEEWTAVGRPYWEKAGVAEKIDLRIGPAIETLRALPGDEKFDLAFIDADKEGYIAYYEELLRVMRPGGLILVDNVLLFGMAADPKTDNPAALAIRAFNDLVAKDPRVSCVMLAISDGLTLLRVR